MLGHARTRGPLIDESVFRYSEGEFTTHAPGNRDSLLVADSFLVDQGRMLAPDAHRDRFVSGAVHYGLDPASARQFWTSAARAIPPVERWFPRFEIVRELGGSIGYQLRVRTAPRLSSRATLASYRGPDPRAVPSLKGPDLHALLRVRAESGADEAVVLDDHGRIVDGATSAVLWWRDDTLARVPDGVARVDSVTARVIGIVAGSMGISLREEHARPEQLAGCEVWIVNALHGIRLVTGWADVPELVADEPRVATWRARLTTLRMSLGSLAD